MANESSVSAGGVILIDPISVNSNSNIVNSIPQYQDMYIFAEFSAKRRGRTMIISNFVSSVDDLDVNMMGVNEDKNNPNNYNFTTNYYDGSMDGGTVLESFGITSINVKVNSSYVPQVSIQFVDIRGLSFFNQEQSPYRILFDFPPPTFTLTIKGYYGKALTYELHMVKYTSEFQAETGNYVIDASFVAMTFAPLSDVLFRYVVNTPLMIDGGSSNPNASIEPKNTNDLILKIKTLYSTVKEKINAEPESKQYENINSKLKSIEQVVSLLNEYKHNVGLSSGGDPLMIIESYPSTNMVEIPPTTQPNENSTYTKIDGVYRFDDIIGGNTSGVSTKNTDRLLIAFISGSIPLSGDTYTENKISIANMQEYLDAFANTILSIKPTTINGTIPKAVAAVNKVNVGNNTNFSTKYVVLDITDLYVKLFKVKQQLNIEKISITTDISSKVNNIVISQLGMMPTVYNIFKIILNDVDVFFRELKKCAVDAEIRHAEDFNIIVGSDMSVENNATKIYAFPLITTKSIVSGGNREERIAPIELSKRASFPELDFVKKFIDTFPTQREINALNDIKNTQNDDGTYAWIPFSPIESKLNGVSDPASPYVDVIDIYQTLLKRFYMITQGIIPYDYVNNTQKGSIAYRKLFAKSEAINLATSSTVIHSKISDKLIEDVKKYGKDLNAFYAYIGNVIDTDGTNMYSFPDGKVTSFNVDKSNSVFVDKSNPEFSGMNLYEGEIILQPTDEATTTPIGEFKSDAKREWYQILAGSPSEYWYEFTNQNVIYIRDTEGDDFKYKETNLATRYIGGALNGSVQYNKAFESGNVVLGKVNGYTDKSIMENERDIMSVWCGALPYYTDLFPSSDISLKLKALLILSNFGTTLGPFNLSPNGLNQLIFNAPAAIEVPMFVPLYVGALVDAIEDGWYVEINDYFNSLTSQSPYVYGNGALIAADLHDIKKYLSARDKTKFRDRFVSYFNNPDGFNSAYNQINEILLVLSGLKLNNSAQEYLGNSRTVLNGLINPIENASAKYFNVIKDLIERTNIIVYSQITFSLDEKYMTTGGDGSYRSIATQNKTTNGRIINDQFFTEFFKTLDDKFTANAKELKNTKEREDKLKGDVDILTQTYYSFKNINDKWLTSQPDSTGYPYNRKNKSLIDSFAFVDRAMNPIGDTIINAEILLDIFNNPDISVFTALSQILSSNGFEFFPLQNFMSFDGDGSNTSWEDCFRINTGVIDGNSTAFVCMYIGGSSSNLSVPSNGFVNDGILDISNPGVSDFSTTEPSDEDKEEQEINWKGDGKLKFPWRKVHAFRVRFGEQNQSMFTNIKINSKEYPETNESIQILSRLAGDTGTAAPTPKGQNLYNLYENRSYSATITSMGNAMIQPTQYFQIENVPLYNGAYIILSVEHSITANKMMTTFSGTKVIKYPSPRVLSPVSFVGFEDISNVSGGQLVEGALLTNYPQTKYNSMYTLKIK